MTTVSAAWELQKAVVALAIANADVQALLKDNSGKVMVYDDVPPASPDGSQTAFVLIGDGNESNIGAEGLPGALHRIALTVCSANVGFKSAKMIAQALRDALDSTSVAINGFEPRDLFWVSTEHSRHPDQATLRQSTVVFAIELRPTS